MSFGEKLTKLRKEKGMSQEDLASNLNVSRQAVSKWESNNSYPETDKIIAICKLFNCSMDELMGLKKGAIKKDNQVIELINKYFDLFIKGIKLFYSMTFKQKVKCMFEMAFYTLIVFCFFIILNSILEEIFTKLFYLLPDQILYVLTQTLRGILYLISLLAGIYILVKLYRVRYLDYYEEYNNLKKETLIEEKVVEEKPDKKISIKEEKIIIRDPEKEIKAFSWLKSLFRVIIKFILSIIAFSLAIAFVILIACDIFVIYFINYGLIITYIALGLLGGVLGIYVILEILIKYIFNMKLNSKRLFLMFVIAMLVVGVSGGLFVCELTTFSIIDKVKYDNVIYEEEIEMEDNLIITSLDDYNTEIVIENRDNILIEIYGTEYNISPIHTYSEDLYCKQTHTSSPVLCKTYTYYNGYDYFNGENYNNFLKNILSLLKEKKIVTENQLFNVRAKIHLSKDSYDKLKQNQDSCLYHTYDLYDYE